MQRWSSVSPLGKGFAKQWVHDNPDELKHIEWLKKKAVLPSRNPTVSSGTKPGTSGTQNQLAQKLEENPIYTLGIEIGRKPYL